MAWTDVFPVFTEEQVDEFEAQATAAERAELEEWYGTERIVNAQPERKDIVSVSLFLKNVRESDPELPTPMRELLKNAQELGLAKRFNRVCYLPFMGCQFGVQGGTMDARQLLDAFTWHAIRGNIDPTAIFPGCGPLTIQAHTWPSYGFDEFFMTVAA